jgi:hypothetical protein
MGYMNDIGQTVVGNFDSKTNGATCTHVYANPRDLHFQDFTDHIIKCFVECCDIIRQMRKTCLTIESWQNLVHNLAI